MFEPKAWDPSPATGKVAVTTAPCNIYVQVNSGDHKTRGFMIRATIPFLASSSVSPLSLFSFLGGKVFTEYRTLPPILSTRSLSWRKQARDMKVVSYVLKAAHAPSMTSESYGLLTPSATRAGVNVPSLGHAPTLRFLLAASLSAIDDDREVAPRDLSFSSLRRCHRNRRRGFRSCSEPS